MSLLNKTSDFLASYKLSCALFLLLLLLTYLGTMHQVEHGLYQSQQKYFESLFLVHWAGNIVPVPLPGGYLVLIAAFINMLWGAAIRFRLRWSNLGFMLMHIGMLMLLAGAFVSYVFSTHARMIIFENETSNELENSYAWEIGIREALSHDAVPEFIIRQKDFEGLSGRRSRLFRFGGLAVELELSGFTPNATMTDANALLVLPPEKEYQRNMAGARVALIDRASGERNVGTIWAGSRTPTLLDASGTSWQIEMRRQRIQLPFSIRLDKFIAEMHPGTDKPRAFTSEITKMEEGISQQFVVTMNEPFRHMGYTFYQSSWGRQSSGPGERLYSVFSVVRNPADQAPLYACIVTTIGLVLHYLRKLNLYLKKEKARQA